MRGFLCRWYCGTRSHFLNVSTGEAYVENGLDLVIRTLMRHNLNMIGGMHADLYLNSYLSSYLSGLTTLHIAATKRKLSNPV